MNLGRNIVLPAALALTIAGVIYGFGKQAGHSDETDRRVAALEERSSTSTKDMAELRANFGARVSVVEANLSNITQTLGRIEGKLDDRSRR